MDTLRKEDLAYTYTWSRYEKDDPKISGIPDATPFNRKEGYEVLYLINNLADHLAWSVESFGNKVEKMIHDRLPEDITTQQETVSWIKENWKNTPVNNTEK
jgi:hypothetical protein